jgi:hypothetical protein
VDDAGRGDNLVGGIAAEVQLRRLPARRQIQRPYLNASEYAREIGRIEIDFNSF